MRPRRVLEIGTDVGASTMSIAAAMKRNGAAPGEGAFITVDIEDIEGAERKQPMVSSLPSTRRFHARSPTWR